MESPRIIEIKVRIEQIKSALCDLSETKVVPVDPASLEDELFDELDELEFQLKIA